MPGPSKRYTPPKRALVVSAEIPEDGTPWERERAARRRLVATTGRCPCGAQLRVPDKLVPGTVTMVAVEHDPACPAVES